MVTVESSTKGTLQAIIRKNLCFLNIIEHLALNKTQWKKRLHVVFKLRLCLLCFGFSKQLQGGSFYCRIDYQSPYFEIGVSPNGA